MWLHLSFLNINCCLITSGLILVYYWSGYVVLTYTGRLIHLYILYIEPPEPPAVAFRRPKSIKDTLVRAAVFRPSSTIGQCKPCGDKRCKYCLQLQHTQAFHSKTTGKEYKNSCNVNCKTPNVAYLLDFHVCGSQYT